MNMVYTVTFYIAAFQSCWLAEVLLLTLWLFPKGHLSVAGMVKNIQGTGYLNKEKKTQKNEFQNTQVWPFLLMTISLLVCPDQMTQDTLQYKLVHCLISNYHEMDSRWRVHLFPTPFCLIFSSYVLVTTYGPWSKGQSNFHWLSGPKLFVYNTHSLNVVLNYLYITHIHWMWP